MKKKVTNRIHHHGPQTPEERTRLREIREKVRQEFPPRTPPRLRPAPEGVAARIRMPARPRD